MPDVDDEDETGGVSFLPDLVFEGVVEDQDTPLLPLPGDVGAADPAAFFGDLESEVHPQPAVGRSGVRPDVSSWLHDRELDLSSPAAGGLRESLQ